MQATHSTDIAGSRAAVVLGPGGSPPTPVHLFFTSSPAVWSTHRQEGDERGHDRNDRRRIIATEKRERHRIRGGHRPRPDQLGYREEKRKRRNKRDK